MFFKLRIEFSIELKLTKEKFLNTKLVNSKNKFLEFYLSSAQVTIQIHVVDY